MTVFCILIKIFNRMKKLLLLLHVTLFFTCTEKNIIQELNSKYERNSLLWKIEKNNETSYLFGTTHIMCKEEMQYKEILYGLVNEVDVIVTEINDKEIDGDPMPFGKGMFGIEIPENYKQKNLFSKKGIDMLKTYYKDRDINDYFIDLMINTDIISASLIEAMISMMNMGCDLTGSELYIESINNIKEYEKEELFLESDLEVKDILEKLIDFTYQNADFSDLNIEAYISYNIKMNSDEELLNGMKNYNNNDPLTEYENFLSLADPLDPNYNFSKLLVDGVVEFLLKERNIMWIPRMIKIMEDENSALFAVGALHVLDLVIRLEKEGYKLTPLEIL